MDGTIGTATGTILTKPKNKVLAYIAVDWLLRRLLKILRRTPRTEAIALWWGYRFRPEPCVVRTKSGVKLLVEPTDYIGLLVYYFGSFEPHILRTLRKLTKPGDTVLDVGANIGTFTLDASSAVGPKGHVIAIEASPPNVAILESNIDINGRKNVTLVATAVGALTSTATISRPIGGNRGSYTLGTADTDEQYIVDLRPIDEILADLGNPTIGLLKIDIEGSELAALHGGTAMLTQDKPAILIEINEAALARNGASAAMLRSFLFGIGYRGWIISDGRSEVINDATSHSCDECLFLHDAFGAFSFPV